MALSPGTILYREPELILEVDSANCVRVHHDQQILEFGQHALAILDTFYHPQAIQTALSKLPKPIRGKRETEEIVTTISKLVDGGILKERSPIGYTSRMFPHGGYGLAALNIAILDDPDRKRAFVAAVEQVVKPHDVVLDLGTGSGVLALAAARAGAKHVYALEPARSGELAREVIQRNGYSDRVTSIKGWSASLELPEPVTVITTDIVGNEVFDMLIWEVVQDARERLSSHDVKIVPSGFTAFLELVDIPVNVVEKHRVTDRHIRSWKDWYGFDFTPMKEAEIDRTAGFYERPEEVSQWVTFSEPQEVFQTTLYSSTSTFTGRARVPANRSGEVNGAVLSFRAELSPGVELDTDPRKGTRKSHWFTACWIFNDSHRVEAGQEVILQYSYAGEGRSSVSWIDGEGG